MAHGCADLHYPLPTFVPPLCICMTKGMHTRRFIETCSPGVYFQVVADCMSAQRVLAKAGASMLDKHAVFRLNAIKPISRDKVPGNGIPNLRDQFCIEPALPFALTVVSESMTQIALAVLIGERILLDIAPTQAQFSISFPEVEIGQKHRTIAQPYCSRLWDNREQRLQVTLREQAMSRRYLFSLYAPDR